MHVGSRDLPHEEEEAGDEGRVLLGKPDRSDLRLPVKPPSQEKQKTRQTLLVRCWPTAEFHRVRTEETDLTRRNRSPQRARKPRPDTAGESPSSSSPPPDTTTATTKSSREAKAQASAVSPKWGSRRHRRRRSASPGRSKRCLNSPSKPASARAGRRRRRWRVTVAATPWSIEQAKKNKN